MEDFHNKPTIFKYKKTQKYLLFSQIGINVIFCIYFLFSIVTFKGKDLAQVEMILFGPILFGLPISITVLCVVAFYLRAKHKKNLEPIQGMIAISIIAFLLPLFSFFFFILFMFIGSLCSNQY